MAVSSCAPPALPPRLVRRRLLPQVKPGPEGYRQFTEAIRRAFNLPDDSELNITFTCDEPSTGDARCPKAHAPTHTPTLLPCRRPAC